MAIVQMAKCRFCAGLNLRYHESYTAVQVCCTYCRARGPEVTNGSIHDAIAAWNKGCRRLYDVNLKRW